MPKRILSCVCGCRRSVREADDGTLVLRDALLGFEEEIVEVGHGFINNKWSIGPGCLDRLQQLWDNTYAARHLEKLARKQ